MGVLAAVAGFIIIMPIIEVMIIGLKLVKVPISFWSGSTKRVAENVIYMYQGALLTFGRQSRGKWDENTKIN